ncbi:cAMP-specific 3',5'-cyclic phosphodiesterase 4A [Irineochytrium annulatum]|nr:cAMP-specific 3',5'-cyclic phosphodiesterase 4A [Irineochytrium annulatum]
MSAALPQNPASTTRRRSSILGLGGGGGINANSSNASASSSPPPVSPKVGLSKAGSVLSSGHSVTATGKRDSIVSRRGSIVGANVVDSNPPLVPPSRRTSTVARPLDSTSAGQILKSYPSVNNSSNPTPPHHSLGGLFSNALMSRVNSQKKDTGVGRTASNSVMSGNSLNGQPPPPAEDNILDLQDYNFLKSRMHLLTLTFIDDAVENEYEKFFLAKNLAKWRRNICIIFLSSTALYLYVMVKSPHESRYWSDNFSESIKLNTTETLIREHVVPEGVTGWNTGYTCPDGWFCAICDPDYLCNAYEFKYDIIFWALGVALPSIVVLATSFRLQAVEIGRHIHLLSSLFTSVITIVGCFARFIVIEPNTPMYETAFLSIIAVTSCFVFLRMRFFHAALSCILIVVAYGLIFFNRIFYPPSDGYAGLTMKVMSLCVLSLAVIGGIICSSCFDAEIFYRGQFLISHNLQKHNMKLMYQLQRLQKVYGNKAADFDSPLEKSVMIIRSMMADPSLTAQHLLELSQVLTLLGSSNLLAPDLENQVTEFMDTEQEAWLFSEIAPRRKTQRNRQSMAMNRRRMSLAQDMHIKISETISEAPQVSYSMGSIPEMKQQQMPNGGRAAPHGAGAANAGHEGQDTPGSEAGTVESINGAGGGLVAGGGSVPAGSGGSVMFRLAGDGQQGSRLALTELESPLGLSSQALAGSTVNGSYGVGMGVAGTPIGSPFAGGMLKKSTPAPAKRQPLTFDDLLDLPRIPDLLARSYEFNWPIFEFADAASGKSLSVLAYHLFKREGLFMHFQIPLDRFWKFITTIEQGYHADIPYYDHPGYNNNFLANTYDVRTILYNDRSVLENHHLASAFTVLKKDDCNFLSQMPKAEFKSLRETIIEVVLATDLSQHFVILSMFKNKVGQSFDPDESREDRVLLWKILMKCSDVSNPTKEWSLYDRWCKLVIEEFMRQGDMEKRLSIPVSPYMDRDNINVPSSQIGFIDYVILPLFDAYDKYNPIPHIMEHLKRNRDHWGYLKALGVIHMANVTPPTNHPTGNNSVHTRESSTHVVIMNP